MDAQHLITALIVAVSALYALWRLAPAALRRAVARALGRPPSSSGGCGGCGTDACAPPAGTPGAVQVIRVQRRTPPGR